MNALTCRPALIERTISMIREAGDLDQECVCLWLARLGGEYPTAVTEVYRPAQVATTRSFRIPTGSMRDLMRYLSANRLKVAAQVHSHPGRAYHSTEDDEWSIVRQVGGISIVVPDFGRRTSAAGFLTDTAIYQMDEAGEWLLVDQSDVPAKVRVE